MDANKITELHNGFETAMVDYTAASNLAYRPQFISNNYKEGRKVLSSIEDELLHCDTFAISVAFITMSGITPLLQTLKELETKNIRGRILTTDYLNFSEPKALEKLSELHNIEIRMYRTEEADGGFHTKGYIFHVDETYRIIIGSSNMTLSALTRNKEWNTRIVSAQEGEIARSIVEEFDDLWQSQNTQKFDAFIENYKTQYEIIRKQREIAKKETVTSIAQYTLKPNSMQIGFIQNLQKLRESGEEKALLISATGTGKTYASAFALRDMNPNKALFLVHREQIAKQAMESFKRVFGSTKSFGLLSGSSKDYEADYLFSTMSMMAKSETLQRFQKDAFDTIIIDEVHRAGAESYQRIMEYFTPQFWLGMTASPDRTDGYDIYGLFDHNIACEIRLQQALEENLLCPFHYFGITDMEVNGEILNDETGVRNFAHLTSDSRVDYVLDKAEYYGHSGDRVKGLVFCSRKEEARELAKQFTKRGFPSVMLSGEDSVEKREDYVQQLTSDAEEHTLSYIFTVDIFNEGVDIPEVNQVILLRPTESPIIFIQQLGRGLRKAENKEYVVILDFIGNYMNNYMIPLALSGDRSYNKDNMRRYVAGGNRMIPGSSSIHFDEISRKRIYASIDSARTNDLALIKESYQNLKFELGRIPSVQDFKEHGAIDINKIFDKCGSYYGFLAKYEKDYDTRLSKEEESIIEFLSQKQAKGKRVDELIILKELLKQQNRLDTYYYKVMKEIYHLEVSEKTQQSVIDNLTNRFAKDADKEKYKNCVFLEETENHEYSIAVDFAKHLENSDFYNMVEELVDLGIDNYNENYADHYKDTNLRLYQKYTYEDVCRLLNWKQNMNAQNIGGYFYDKETKTLPVFINYEKAEDAIAYEDRFVSPKELIALSKHPRSISSSDAVHIYKLAEEDKENRIYLFVRKNKDDKEAKEFYFLGEINAVGAPIPVHMESTKDDAFEINYRLDIPVREDVYGYITEE